MNPPQCSGLFMASGFLSSSSICDSNSSLLLSGVLCFDSNEDALLAAGRVLKYPLDAEGEILEAVPSMRTCLIVIGQKKRSATLLFWSISFPFLLR